MAAAVALLGLGLPAASANTGADAPDATRTAQRADTIAATPYMGWSSWSMQSSSYPGLNPKGQYSYLTEANVLKQTDAMASKLKKYGYDHVNIDAGWWYDWDWKPNYDSNGRQTADPERFPHGMKYVADRVHAKGLKAGIYLPVGLEKPAYGEGKVPIQGAEGCTTADIVYPDLRTTNGWDSSYKIDFGKPCAQKYIDSQARQFADWGYDFLKLDGVGPGSFKTGDNYDNVPDVAAWKQAIQKAGRPIHLEVSWSLDINHIDDWKKYSNGWRVDTDVECYCNTLVTWENSVVDRWTDTPAWTSHAAPGGWNDLDAVDVGNGEMDGLTKAERQSYMTLWAISKSPLFTGDDITKLDKYGVSLLTNREVIALDQNRGGAARPVSPAGDRQVWGGKNPDGSYTVALFNLGDKAAPVSAHWTSLGFTGKASVRDLWSREEIGGHRDGITATLPAHGSRLFTVLPRHGSDARYTGYEAEAAANSLSGPASVGDCADCSGGRKVGNLYDKGSVRFNDVTVREAGTYALNVYYTAGDARSLNVSANGGEAAKVDFPLSGGWGTSVPVTVEVKLKAGTNTVTFDSGSGYGPDLDKIDIPTASE